MTVLGSSFPRGVQPHKHLPLPDRFWAKVDQSGGSDACWPWLAFKQSKGYGLFAAGKPRRSAHAHRWAYEFAIGPIPAGLTVDHLCRNRACVNPSHLEPVTNHENMLRGFNNAARNARKTHCPQGHPYDEANTRVWGNGRHRDCRACDRARSRRRVAAKREARTLRRAA